MRRLVPLLMALLAALGLLTSCGAEDSVDASEPPPMVPADAIDASGQAVVEVAVGDNNYEPQVVVVSPGTEVVWTNLGRNRHNVISSDDEPAFDQIDTEQLDDGGSASRVFADVGEYPYYCSIHGSANRGQRGTVLVVPAEG